MSTNWIELPIVCASQVPLRRSTHSGLLGGIHRSSPRGAEGASDGAGPIRERRSTGDGTSGPSNCDIL